jgi:hypothetical protein
MRSPFLRLAAGLLSIGSIAVIASLAATGCSGDDTTSPVTPIDAGDAAQDTGTLDAATAADASQGTGGDAGALNYLDGSAQCAPDASHGGHRWQDLYTCYFGGTGIAACGTMSGCHGNPSDEGVLSSDGFMCDPADAGACWQSMTSVLVPDGSASDPVDTTLYTALRKTDGTGSMPLVPVSLVFQTGDMARISAWITSGAPNN